MGNMRVTERSIAASVLTGLQGNIARLGEKQQQLSSGKLISRASDSPGGAVAAMQFRSEIATQQQYSRNADDGIGWLGSADTTLTDMVSQVNRARELVLQGLNTGSNGPQAREAFATEIDNIRTSLIGLANTKYVDRPIFGGTTNGTTAYDTDGTYLGDAGTVVRTIGENAKVRVDVNGPDVFGAGAGQLFTVLSDISTALRANSGTLGNSLTQLDAANTTIQTELSRVGARYNQVTQARQTADDRVLNLKTALSDVEDIDLPKTITELQLQQTAYQAALAATAKVIQPSLVDFLR